MGGNYGWMDFTVSYHTILMGIKETRTMVMRSGALVAQDKVSFMDKVTVL